MPLTDLIDTDNNDTTDAHDLCGHECQITIGGKVRSWDFEPPMPGRKDAYIEGEFVGWHADGRLIITVEIDTLHPDGARDFIFTGAPGTMIFGEWNGRITCVNPIEKPEIKYEITKAWGTLAKKDGSFHMLMGSPIIPSDLDLENVVGIGEKPGAEFKIELNNSNSVIFSDLKNLFLFMKNWEKLENTKS